MTDCIERPRTRPLIGLPNLPLVIWMVVAALALALVGGNNAGDIIGIFNAGWGRALGEFALILLPSFTLAAALSRHRMAGVGLLSVGLAPASGAGMVCPDTAYAALSPIADQRKLQVAFGSYAGFKLLFPAGPLLVAIGLGITETSIASILLYGLVLLIPVWAIGLWWASRLPGATTKTPDPTQTPRTVVRLFAPFIVLAALLVVGEVVDPSEFPLLDLITRPVGALWGAAILALLQIAASERRACIDSAVSRTGSLLFVIGAASAFGAVLTSVIPVAQYLPQGGGLVALFGLFALTAAFKIIQGSSMATFAAVTPVAAPVVIASQLSPTAAVFAICLGSFVAILPNDSFYWLVRKDALVDASDKAAFRQLATGSVLQAGIGLIVLTGLVVFGMI